MLDGATMLDGGSLIHITKSKQKSDVTQENFDVPDEIDKVKIC